MATIIGTPYNDNGTNNGGAFRPQLFGTSTPDWILGLAGDDVLHGLESNDNLYGYSGDDSLNGGTGTDSMSGGTGNDAYLVDTRSDRVIEYAYEGTDHVYSSVSTDVRWLPDNVENLSLIATAYYGDGNDLGNSISGNNSANRLFGYGGNDFLYGYGGNDYLYGAEGYDRLDGGAGTDTMYGGTENDIYYVDTASDQVIEFSDEGHDSVNSSVTYTLPRYVENLTITSAAYYGGGNGLNNAIFGNNFSNSLSGSGGNDTLYAYGGNDYLYGGEGNDFLYGYGGNDYLYGDGGNDYLFGNEGGDTLTGGVGTDTMYGGSGADRFDYNALSDSPGAEETSPVVIRDIIRDFNGGGDDLIDQIDLSTIDANLNLEGNQAFATNQLSYSGGIFTANVIGFGIPGSLDLQIQLYDNPPLDIVGSTNDIIL